VLNKAHWRECFPAAFLLAAFFAAPCASAADLTAAQKALMQGRVGDVISTLRPVVAANPNDGAAHLLLCRAYYAEQVVDPAVAECDAALRTLSKDGDAQSWAGRVYGLKATRGSVFTGYGMAKRVKAAFEAAVALNESNPDAIDDLGEYYVEAPGLVGGGLDKAADLAARVQAKQPQRAARLQALIAERKKDYPTAERLYRSIVDSTGGRDDAWLDLGNFYTRRKSADQAAEAFKNSYKTNKRKDSSLLGVATGLDQIQREPALAIQALQDYLNGGDWNDFAPTFKARTLLAKYLVARGDKAGAKAELTKALALAPDYEPAKKALAAL
jgi:tetratricopeptide (TPR) repeat protein